MNAVSWRICSLFISFFFLFVMTESCLSWWNKHTFLWTIHIIVTQTSTSFSIISELNSRQMGVTSVCCYFRQRNYLVWPENLRAYYRGFLCESETYSSSVSSVFHWGGQMLYGKRHGPGPKTLRWHCVAPANSAASSEMHCPHRTVFSGNTTTEVNTNISKGGFQLRRNSKQYHETSRVSQGEQTGSDGVCCCVSVQDIQYIELNF